MLKRSFDIAASAVGAIVLCPLMLLIWVAVRLDSPGPAIFKQVRDGMHGVPFVIYKFRTMRTGSGVPGETLGKNDERFTRVGRWLRPLHFDELPQLFNVLVGDMSIVGPRPLTPELVETRLPPLFQHRYQARLCGVRPGLTGITQIVGRRGHQSVGFAQALWYDLHYIRRRTFAYDLILIWLTVHLIGRRLVGLPPHRP